ncbi:MAG: VOC family protein [Rhodocyclaceae bacterium]|nr:VOC family protein [Rhodocyclaceae bacterium]
MKQAISLITLGVGDLARSRAFYKALGWRESSASQETIAFYQAGSTAFALFARASLAEDANVSPQGSGFPRLHARPQRSNGGGGRCHAARSRDAGVPRARGRKRHGAATAATSADPDGFLWEVCFNPFFPLDENGFVTLPE